MSYPLINIFHNYLNQYSQRNLDGLFQLFSKDFTGFGTGIDENSFEGNDFRELYIREIDQIPQNLDIHINHEKIHPHSDDFFTALADLDIIVQLEEGKLSFRGLRLSCVFQNYSGHWKLVHKHISMPISVQEEGETVPIKELQKINRELEVLVAKKTQELQEYNEQLEIRNKELLDAINEVKKLKSLLPIFSNCKKVRDDKGYWQSVEEYLIQHTDIRLTHSICKACISEHYPGVEIEDF